MSDSIEIRQAHAADAEWIGQMISRLLCELYPDLAPDYQPAATIATARRLLGDGGYVALAAIAQDGAPCGVVGLNECKAIYAHGAFGEIAELYVTPEFRSAGVGAQLVRAAMEFGRLRHWSLIEVGAPDVPRWQRTVDFYLRQGFVNVGPRLYRDLKAA
ncbi:MAG TPA: GNAT family N-acetyltransferase [Alphaproteobacteria bacterium]|nr:GNAT family N-acetyltransferase [Alphaproteobacteria bacterium]